MPISQNWYKAMGHILNKLLSPWLSYRSGIQLKNNAYVSEEQMQYPVARITKF